MQKTKKVKYIGTQEYINADTGELIEMQVSDIEERDFNFKKVWMKDFLNAMELVGNKKTKVAYYIVDSVKKDNTIGFTYEEIAEELNCSRKTVGEVVNALLKANFMRKIRTGAYHINPNLIFKGGNAQRLYNLNIYNSTPKKEITDEEKIANLQKSINQMIKQIEAIQAKKEQKKEESTTVL